MVVHVVGGGIAGLVAAVEVVERGGQAVVHERSRALGGRARSSTPPYVTNFGPHAIYADGPLWKWLKARKLLPPTRKPSPFGARFVLGGKARSGVPRPVRRAIRLSFADAPSDISYREWLVRRGVPEAELDPCCRVACFYSFDADPGRLSARFVNERNARLVRPPSPSRFVSRGGWQALVDNLESHAREVGVEIRTGDRIAELPPPPVIVTAELSAAGELLGEELMAPRAEAVLLDVALTARRREPAAVLDLDGGVFVERYTAFDETLAPPGEELLQCHCGMRPGESRHDAVARIEKALDLTFRDWRARETWRAVRLSDGRSGAVELPDVPWSARPRVERRAGVFLAGDAVAAPGLLSEVAVVSATRAAAAACDAAARPVAA